METKSKTAVTISDVPGTADAAPKKSFETVPLDNPIQRGEQTIDAVQIRKPKAGELRGLNLQAVSQGDTNALLTLLPRITVPPLLQHEVDELEPEDLTAMAGAVMGFFMTKAERAAMHRLLGMTDEGTT